MCISFILIGICRNLYIFFVFAFEFVAVVVSSVVSESISVVYVKSVYVLIMLYVYDEYVCERKRKQRHDTT